MTAPGKQPWPEQHNQLSELDLARRSADGEREAFEQIYRRHCARIYGLCLRLTADVNEAEQLVQDTFVRAWFAIAGFRGHGSLGGWLGRLAVNLWRDRLRSRRRNLRMIQDLEPAPAAGGVFPLLTGIDLERCIARLPEGGRAVYVLHDVEGYTHREIAGLMNIATGTVKAQLHRARGLLRAMLTEKKETSHGS
jgi:RNA polymerase sigma-70 factor (ECF subfamily)